MKELSELLEESVTDESSFGTDAVERRVRSRRHRRQLGVMTAGAVLVGLLVVAGIVIRRDDSSDLEIDFVDPPSTSEAPITNGDDLADVLTESEWLLVTLDETRYEDFGDGWGGTSPGRVRRPVLSIDSRVARFYTGCRFVQFTWSLDDERITFADPAGGGRPVCPPPSDVLDDLAAGAVARGGVVSLAGDQLTIGDVEFVASSTDVDLADLDGWQLATVDGAPAIADVTIGASAGAATGELGISLCDTGRSHRFILDGTGSVAVLAVSGGGDITCDRFSPDPTQGVLVEEVLTEVPSFNTVGTEVFIRTADHVLTFQPPPSPVEGLLGFWEAAWVDGEPSQPGSMFLRVEDQFHTEACSLGLGPHYEWEADHRLILGDFRGADLYDCDPPAEPTRLEAGAISDLLLAEPLLRVRPNAFRVDKDGHSVVFTRTLDNQARVDAQLAPYIAEVTCVDDADCEPSFRLGATTYVPVCVGVHAWAVTETRLGVGQFLDTAVSIHEISSVDPAVVVAIDHRVIGCQREGILVGPSRLAVAVGTNDALQAEVECSVGALGAERAAANGCGPLTTIRTTSWGEPFACRHGENQVSAIAELGSSPTPASSTDGVIDAVIDYLDHEQIDETSEARSASLRIIPDPESDLTSRIVAAYWEGFGDPSPAVAAWFTVVHVDEGWVVEASTGCADYLYG